MFLVNIHNIFFDACLISHNIIYISTLPASKNQAKHFGCFSATQTAFSKFSQSLFDIKCLGKAQYILFTLSHVLLLLWVVFSLILKSTWNLMWMKTRLWETDSQFLQWHTLYFGKPLNLTNQYVVKKKQYKPLNTPYFYCTVPQNK